MRIAILDLGTNTFHLLIAEVNGAKFKTVFKTKIAVKLGEGAIHKNRIAKVPFQRGLKTIDYYKKVIDRYKPEKVFAFATSAIRSATNGKKFVQEIRERTGIRVKVISGAREAELICYGVRQCVSLKGKPGLIMDIGGGSTEFIIADDKQIYWKKSFNIGAARLLEMFRPSDPITDNEIIKLEKFLDKELAPLNRAIKRIPVTKLIGSSGSFDTFAEMVGYKYHDRYVLMNRNRYKFNLAQFDELYNYVLHSTFKQRLKMKGLIRMRVDMIVLAGICTNYVLKKFNIREMHLSKYALKEGAMYYVTGNIAAKPQRHKGSLRKVN